MDYLGLVCGIMGEQGAGQGRRLAQADGQTQAPLLCGGTHPHLLYTCLCNQNV